MYGDESSVSNTLKEIYNSLFTFLQNKGYILSKQNVSINILINGYSVDLVPAKRQDAQSVDHSLYRRKADTWTKTNVNKHITDFSDLWVRLVVMRLSRPPPVKVL